MNKTIVKMGNDFIVENDDIDTSYDNPITYHHKSSFMYDFLKVVGMLFVFLVLFFTILLTNGCSSGWVIAGYELSSIDSSNVEFIEIMDKDSMIHIHDELILNADVWCYLHNQFEIVSEINGG